MGTKSETVEPNSILDCLFPIELSLEVEVQLQHSSIERASEPSVTCTINQKKVVNAELWLH